MYRDRFDIMNEQTNRNRSYCVDHHNPSAPNSWRSPYNYGNSTIGTAYSCSPSYSSKPTTKGRYLGNGQYVED